MRRAAGGQAGKLLAGAHPCRMQIKELGRGCFGSVWLVKWRGVEVAVKEMLQCGQDTSPAEVRSQNTAPTCAALQPPDHDAYCI
jgi:hypothetical protein